MIAVGIPGRLLGAGLILQILGSFAHGQIYVAPSGNDQAAGTARKPVATLSRAVQLSRSLPAEKRRVIVGGGEYFDSSVVLSSEDSNLVIESTESTRATLIGGVPLTGWQPDGDRFWVASLPAGRDWDVRMLQVNGRFCPRARFPEEGTLTHVTSFDVPWMSTTGGGWKRKPTQGELTTMRCKPEDVPASIEWTNAEVTVFHMWDESVAAVRAFDPMTGELKLNPALGHPPGAFGVKKYCLWNIREGMTQPGQWYFDRARSRIVYWPLRGEDMKSAKVVVPTQRSILHITGATNIKIRGLCLEVTTVPLVTGGFAAAAFDGAVQAERCNFLTLSNLTIRNVAGQAIKAMRGNSNVRVDSCELANCGAGGVYISGSNHVVFNNHIHDVGLMFPSAMGIDGGGPKALLSHNEIHDTPYSAIDFGGENVLIEFNRIYRCMKVLHDGAAIYTFGSRKSAIRNNLAYEIVDTGGYGASAYYLDEQCRECCVENNVSVNVARPSHNHMATNNIIRHNVFINEGDLHITFPRSSGFSLEGNVLYATGKIIFEGINNVDTWSGNLLYSGLRSIEGKLLKDYGGTGTTNGVQGDTLVADPLFYDVAKLDLRYRPGSPARDLGLRPIDVSNCGRLSQASARRNP